MTFPASTAAATICSKRPAVVAAAGLGIGTMLLLRKSPVLRELLQFPKRCNAPFVDEHKVVLLTGATDPAGMGAQLALMYHDRFRTQKEVRLVIVGYQSVEQLMKECGAEKTGTGARMQKMLSSDTTLYLQVDLLRPDCGQWLADGLIKAGVKRVHVVIQLAGMGWVGPVASQADKNVHDIVNVNVRAAALCTKHVLPFLGLRQDGPGTTTSKLVYVSSIVSQKPTPMFAVYTATKAAVDHLAWSLSSEFKGTNVSVQLLHPGATRTNFHKNSGVKDGAFDRSKFASPVCMAESLRDSIDYSLEFRTCFGTFQEKMGFYLGWLLPQQLWRFYKNRSPVQKSYDHPRDGGSVVRCVVTGGSKGIGQALLKTRPANHSVLSLSRTCAEGPAGEGVIHKKVDMGCCHLGELLEVLGPEPVDILINNAGVNFSGRLSYLSDEQIDTILRVNVVGPILLTIACLRKNADLAVAPPAFCFISSMSHYFSYPGSSVYGSSKDALASFAKSLGYALSSTTSVLTVFPGPTRTDQAKENSPAMTPEQEEARAKTRLDPTLTAQETWEAIRCGAATLVPGPGVRKMASKAARDPAWAADMMRKTQLQPLMAKHSAESGDAGL